MKFLSGLTNCHVPGMYSFVISPRLNTYSGMKRIFYTTKELPLYGDDGDFYLKPHNHRQSVQLTYLFGEVTNIHCDIYPYTKYQSNLGIWGYKFGSGLLEGKFSLEPLGQMIHRLEQVPFECTPVQWLEWYDIHTVVALPDSAWVVDEFEVAPSTFTPKCFSRYEDLTLSAEGLYVPVEEKELRYWEEKLTEKLKVTEHTYPWCVKE